jgi:hypothetical protein
MIIAQACFGCGKSFDRALLEEVGDALFCRLCLGRLLRRVDERDGADRTGARAPASDAVAVIAPAADAPCFLCGETLEGEAFVRLRGFAICAACSRAFAVDPVEEEDGRAATPPAGGDHGPDRDHDGDASGASGRNGGTAAPIERCAGCERILPGPGSYRLLEGRPHCPECVAARPVPRRGGADPDAEACDACRRAVDIGALRSVRGFRLCLACIESDRELALSVAQARHRRRLEDEGRRLLGEEDDD